MPVQNSNIQDYEKRFGVVAIEKGFITLEQLVTALRIQVLENVEEGTHRLIGEILFDQGLMSTEQIDQVLKVVLIPERKGS
jgi:hypothetical protein